MLVNPFGALPVLPGTRILSESFGLDGVRFDDPQQRGRVWFVYRLFAPIAGRALGGVRAKLVDNKGVITFVNQRDLELLLELAKPGEWCHWANCAYPGLNDELDGWYGLCCDAEDLRDDLHEHELILRQQYQSYGYLPSGLEYTRNVHMDKKYDVQEGLVFLWDKDTETNYGPDGRLETIERRWRSVERRQLQWEMLVT